jgi:hypothetical protein
MGLTPEQAEAAAKAHEDALKEALNVALENHVPKAKLDEVVTENGQLTTSLAERDNQLKALQGASGGIEAIKKQLADAIAQNETDSKSAAAELAAYKKDNALNLALAQAGAKNPTAVKALLDSEKIIVDGERLIGFNEQIEALKTSDDYLFTEGGGLSGREPSAGSGGANPSDPKDNPFKKETYNLTKQAEIYKKDPEQAKRLAAAAGVSPTWLK